MLSFICQHTNEITIFEFKAFQVIFVRKCTMYCCCGIYGWLDHSYLNINSKNSLDKYDALRVMWSEIQWMVNHGSQQVLGEISFGTPIYGLHAKWKFYSTGTCFLSTQGRKNKMVCIIQDCTQNLIFQRHDRKRNISQETTSGKGVISQSSQVSRRLSHNFFLHI